MTHYLCDTNVWVALAIDSHAHHEPAQHWLDNVGPADIVYFCRDTQRSFLRLLTNAGLMNRYALPAISNEEAWSAYDSLLADTRISYVFDEPDGLERYWREYSTRATASTNLWMDAYLAAFARASGYRFVTADAAFRQFVGLDLLLYAMPDEADRVRDAYARRDRLGLDARYDYWRPHNLFIYHARERAVLSLLDSARLLPLTGRRVLDVGCGDGSVLAEMLRYGAAIDYLHGIDLLPDRLESARTKLPGAHIHEGDARSLPFDDASFDLVLGFTLLSSVVDLEARRAVAGEMARVTKAGGVVLLYDFWTNPTNRDVRPLRRSEVRGLFAGMPVDFESTTLAPPVTRALFRLPGGRVACTLLDVLPFLRTHFVAAVHV